jgi:hypothetical protein
VSGRELLLWQAGFVLAGMAVLALLKRHTRRTGLDRYVRKRAKASRFIPIGPAPGRVPAPGAAVGPDEVDEAAGPRREDDAPAG